MWQRADQYFVYILYCLDIGQSYVGHTSHLIVRYHEHRNGESRWTRRMRRPVCLYWEAYRTRSEAMVREKWFKSGMGYEERQRIIAMMRPPRSLPWSGSASGAGSP